MKNQLEKCLELSVECCALCDRLTQCFQDERRYLVEFKTDELQANNVLKDELIRDLSSRRTSLRLRLADLTSEEVAGQAWQQAAKTWLEHWSRMREHAEENQNFLRHSLRNLDMMSDNLMRLFGQLRLYNNKGGKIERANHRPLVEGSY